MGVLDESQQEVLNLTVASNDCDLGYSLPTTLLECLALEDILPIVQKIGAWVYQQSDRSKYIHKVSEVKLKAPIPRPSKNILCVGKNYRDHVLEMGSEADIPENIMIFTKAPTSVIGPDETIPLHEGLTSQLDYEGELAIVIGKVGKAIPVEQALDYVFGYTILNDVTARDLQAKHKQFFLGKSLDGSCPIGPAIVHKSALGDMQKVTVTTRVNGELRQEASTALMIFPLAEIIATLSQGMTLEPGDIIATGTPSGVGKGFKPPRFLKKGDVIEISVEGLGVLRNTVG